jgi:hypothetical protein
MVKTQDGHRREEEAKRQKIRHIGVDVFNRPPAVWENQPMEAKGVR